MKKLKNQAFTLVELIVVITILAILGTIAFISFQGYSSNARDGVRISDTNNVKQNLGIFITEKGFYPIPDNGTQITYSGGTAWTQGTVGDNVITNLRNLSKKPTDPLSNNEYTYSIANNNVEYQLSYVTEGGLSYNIPLLTNQANAATTKKATARVTGTYNEKLLKVSTGTTTYILAVPSIINANLTTTNLQNIITNKELVYNNYQNLPDSYKNLGYTMTGGFEFAPANIVVLSGATISLETGTGKVAFIDNLKKIYNSTILNQEPTYTEIINADTSLVTLNPATIQLVDAYISNHVGGLVGVISTTISYLNCTFNGDTVSHSTSVTAYQTANVSYGNTCTSEQRTCTNGTLSGSYIFSVCNVDGATGTFTLSATSVTQGTNVTISNTCSTPPTSYTSSNTAVATVAGTTITTLSAGTTDITPVGGACGDNASKTLTVTTPPFVCGTSTVIAGGYTYNTKVALDGKCRTVGSMKHGTKLTAGTTVPSNINTIEKWCYSNLDTNCDTYGGLYTWYEAMGLPDTATTTTIEDTSKSVCGQLGAGWAMPTDAQWTALTTAGATGRTGNKLNGLISSLPGYRYLDGSFNNLASNGYWWSSTRSSSTYAYNRTLFSGDATVNSYTNNKLVGFSVLCLKN